mmetsp:Transcript_10179/g.25526  ORF Transcript_10179/g.25526 Transcript_10179/m.25526 type:complete len:216 (+) Transcript_10179:264-911(+)
MRKVDDRLAILEHLMEHIISEELEQIPITSFGPTWIHLKLWPLVDEAKLRDQAEKATIIHFFREFILQAVCVGMQMIHLLHHTGRQQSANIISARVVGRWGREYHHEVFQLTRVMGEKRIDRFVKIVQVRGPTAEQQNETTQREKILLLMAENRRTIGRVKIGYVKNTGAHQPQTVLACDQNLRRMDNTTGQTCTVNLAQCRDNLTHKAPDHIFL